MWHRVLIISIIFLATANFLVWSILGLGKAYAARVYPGIWVDTQPLAGLTKEQVIDRLKPINEAALRGQVSLVVKDKEYKPTLAQLGYQIDTTAMATAALETGRSISWQGILQSLIDYRTRGSIPVIYSVDQTKFDSYLGEIGKDVAKEPHDLSFDYKDGQIVTIPASQGVNLDKEELRSAIMRKVKPGTLPRIELDYHEVQPTISNESQADEAKTQLSKLLSGNLTVQAEEVKVVIEPPKIFQVVYFEPEAGQLKLKINEDKVRELVGTIAKKVDIKPVNKEISGIDGSTMTEGSDGRELNAPDATKRITERLQNADYSSPVVLAVSKIDHKTITVTPEYQTGRFPGRYIEIDLSAQRMHLIEGNNYHQTFIISSGKWDKPTPIGEFEVHNHVPTAFSRRYGLYMPFWMAITNDGGYGIHQLPYWPGGRVEGISHLGRPVSHGCIRLGPGDAEYVYNWAENGTKVVIHE